MDEIITATILKVTKEPSRFGGSFYYIFFKSEDGRSFKTCTAPSYRNFRLWKPFCADPDRAVGTICEGLHVKEEGLIDADFLSKTRLAKGEKTNE